jgi:Arc/MetJ-type ribon-helix-helix transcriptional regulator
MHEIRLNDQLYREVERRARAGGYASVDDFVAEQLESGFSDDLDQQFTPQVIARLDRISSDMKAGKSVSMEEVDKHLADTRNAWLKDHAS